MKAGRAEWHEFADGAALAGALAAAVAGNLRDALAERGRAILAVSGGTTPGRFFDALSVQELDWTKVTVTLIDERFVRPTSERSNARLVGERLLRNAAASAKFVGLYYDLGDIDSAAEVATEALASALPFDAVVLGMGNDGHTASLFPDAEDLDMLLDPETPAGVYVVRAPSAGEPRLSWPLSAIAMARNLYLHIEGDRKRTVAESAMASGVTPPVGRVLADAKSPPQIFWAPAG